MDDDTTSVSAACSDSPGSRSSRPLTPTASWTSWCRPPRTCRLSALWGGGAGEGPPPALGTGPVPRWSARAAVLVAADLVLPAPVVRADRPQRSHRPSADLRRTTPTLRACPVFDGIGLIEHYSCARHVRKRPSPSRSTAGSDVDRSRRLDQPVRARGLNTADQQPWPSSGTPQAGRWRGTLRRLAGA
jgi:hypothetical protein